MFLDLPQTENNYSVTFLEPTPNQEEQATENNAVINEFFGSSAKPTADTP